MPKLFLVLLTTLFALSIQASARDFELLCPCSVELQSDTLALVSFQLSRTYEEQSVTGFTALLTGGGEYGATFSVIGEVEVSRVPAAGETESYALKLPIRFVSVPQEVTTLRIRANLTNGSTSSIAERALDTPIAATSGLGYSSFDGDIVFLERVDLERRGDRLHLAVPSIQNLGQTEQAALTLTVRQANPETGTFFSLDQIELGPLAAGDRTQPFSTSVTLRVAELETFSDISVDIRDNVTDTTLLVDPITSLSDARKLYENYYRGEAIRFFLDTNNDGVSDYNEARFGPYLHENQKDWEIAVSVLVDAEAAAVTQNARARVDHLIAHTNNILRSSGVKAKVRLANYETVGSSNGLLISANERDDILSALTNFNAPFEIAQEFFEDDATDLIVAFAESTGEDTACGVAQGWNSNDGNLFGPDLSEDVKAHFFVVGINCPDSVFAHELGHIAGLGHSRPQREMGARSFSVGYGSANEFMTIMPYREDFDAPEVELFSSPELLGCNGLPCGIPRARYFDAADAVFTLNQTTPHLAMVKNGGLPSIVIFGPENISVVQGRSFNDPGASAVDPEDGDLSNVVTSTGAVDTSIPGGYAITYSVQDSDGNQAYAIRRVIVIADADGDQVLFSEDNCPNESNNDQADLDGDGIGNVCDADADGDGLNNNGPTTFIINDEVTTSGYSLTSEFSFAQSFTMPVDGSVTGIGTHLKCSAGAVFIDILGLDGDGRPAGSPLAQASIRDVTSAAGPAFSDFTLFPGLAVVKGERLAMVLRANPAAEGNCFWYLSPQDNDTYKGGEAFFSRTDGDISWVKLSDETSQRDFTIRAVYALSDSDDDNDGVADDVDAFPLDPTKSSKDSDNDGIEDDIDTDDDNDGLTDLVEEAVGTNPKKRDSDGDSVNDGEELQLGLDPLVADCPSYICTSSRTWLWVLAREAKQESDDDEDGLTFAEETRLGLDPRSSDSDGDGIGDGREVLLGSNPLLVDSDGDGLSDGEEVSIGTNPRDSDTDGDSVNDADELSLSLDPLESDCPSWMCSSGLPVWFFEISKRKL